MQNKKKSNLYPGPGQYNPIKKSFELNNRKRPVSVNGRVSRNIGQANRTSFVENAQKQYKH